MEPSSQAVGNNEKKYVSLDTGSKLSGYTQDYLERLCRLKKVGYRIRTDGQFVIELESLLQETQTILLSHDGIAFVDKGELADPVPEVTEGILSSALKEVKTVTATMPYLTPSSPVDTETISALQAVVPPPATRVEPGESTVSAAASVTPQVIMPVGVPIPAVTQEVNQEVVSQAPFQSLIPNIAEPVSSVPAPIVPIKPLNGEITPPTFSPMPIPEKTPVTSPAPLPITVREEQVAELVSAPRPLTERAPISASPLSLSAMSLRPTEINTDALSVVSQPSGFVSESAAPTQQSLPSATLPLPSTPIAPIEKVNIPSVEIKDVPSAIVPVEINTPPLSAAELLSAKQSMSFDTLSVPPIKEEIPQQEVTHDDWDTLLLGATPVVFETPSETLSVPSKPTPLNREYHPIQTSVDPRAHYDDGPLFPVPNPDGVAKKGNTEIRFDVPTLDEEAARASVSVPKSIDSRQRVIVYAPEDYLNNKLTRKIPVAPNKLGAINPPSSSALPPSIAPKSEPVLPAAIIRKEGSVPSLRVMPGLPAVERKILPMKAEEHRVSIKEDHPLIKNVGLNLVFAAVLVSSSFVFLNSAISNLGKRLSDLDNAAYVASVGAVDTDVATTSTPDTQKNADELTLPFSDEVLVSPGSKTNSVIVRPVFKTGPGGSYEYTLAPIGTTSTSTP